MTTSDLSLERVGGTDGAARAATDEGASRPALVALAAYLALALPWAARAGGALLAAHVLALLAVVALAWRPARAPGWIAFGLPVAALPLAYAELAPLIAAAHAGMRDATVLGWESALFGAPARTLATRFSHAWLSETLHAGYLSYYALIVVPPLLLARRGRRRALGETVLALTLAYAACFLIFLAFPVEGPRYRFGAAPDAPAGPFRDLARLLLAGGSSRGTAFPSSHVAVSVAQAALALRHQPRVGVAVSVCALLVAVGAVYGGFHYATDVVVGLAVGLLAAWAATHWPRAASR